MISIVKQRNLQAGNIHARRPVIVLSLSQDAPAKVSNQVVSAIAGALPPLLPTALDFPLWRDLVVASKPVPTVSIVEALAIVIQRFVNWPVSYCGSHRPFEKSPSRAAREVVFEAGDVRAARKAGQIAVELANLVVANEYGDEERLRAVFGEHLHSYYRSTIGETPYADALAVAAQAAARGIPWGSVPKTKFVRLGQSRKTRLLVGSESAALSSIDKQLVAKKDVAWKALRRAGIPVARQRIARSSEDIERCAEAIGYPVTVEPATGRLDVTPAIDARDDYRPEQEGTLEGLSSEKFVVKNLVQGDRFRLLVIDGKFVAACRRRPAQVIGDGRHTVHDLVEQENRRPERRALLRGRSAISASITIDAGVVAFLNEQGLDPNSVPEAGRVVFLGDSTKIADGGDAVDVTDEVHPELGRMAERAAGVLGLGVCGFDLVTTDVSRPIEETQGAIYGVNTRPGLGLHLVESQGRSQPVDKALLNMLFPKGTASRIPVVAALPGQGTRSLLKAVERAAKRAGITLGVYQAQPAGDRRDSKHILPLENGAAADLDHRLDAAFLEVDPRKLARSGLGLERIELAVVPEGNGNKYIADAATILSRAANNRAVSSESPELVQQVLTALGLPTRRLGTQRVIASVSDSLKEIAPGPTFCVTFVGDIGFGESYMHQPSSGPLQSLLEQKGYGHSVSGLVGMLDGADCIVGNLEVPLAERPDIGLRGRKKYLGWSDPDLTVDALADAKFSAVSLANNHALDCGTSGLLATLGRLRQRGIAAFGAGSNRADAQAPFIQPFMVGSQRCNLVVFAGYQRRARYERYQWYAGRNNVGVSVLDPKRIGDSIQELRQILANPVFVVYPHWGMDYQQQVADEQREMAQALAEAGAHLVIGHGSHTMQRLEMIANSPVLFGLGNFVWNSPGRYGKRGALPYGLVASLIFEPRGQGVATRLRLYPIVTDNEVTRFRNHGVDREQFGEIANLLEQAFPGEIRRGYSHYGHYMDIPIHGLFSLGPLATATQADVPELASA